MENAHSLTRAAIQLRKWVIAGVPSFPSGKWKESVTVETVAIGCDPTIKKPFFREFQSVTLHRVNAETH